MTLRGFRAMIYRYSQYFLVLKPQEFSTACNKILQWRKNSSLDGDKSSLPTLFWWLRCSCLVTGQMLFIFIAMIRGEIFSFSPCECGLLILSTISWMRNESVREKNRSGRNRAHASKEVLLIIQWRMVKKESRFEVRQTDPGSTSLVLCSHHHLGKFIHHFWVFGSAY